MKKFLIKVNGNEYEVEVEEIMESSAVSQPKGTPATAAPAPKPAAPAVKAAENPKNNNAAQGALSVTAPIPGIILSVNVNAGDVVKKGQVLVILEAMKMENEIVAPSDGKIVSVNVTKDSSVNAGDLLVSME